MPAALGSALPPPADVAPGEFLDLLTGTGPADDAPAEFLDLLTGTGPADDAPAEFLDWLQGTAPADDAPGESMDWLSSGMDPSAFIMGLPSENRAPDDAVGSPGSPAAPAPADGSAVPPAEVDVASGLEQKVTDAITTLSAVVPSDQATRFEEWALKVFDFDPGLFDMGVAGVFQPVLDAFGAQLAELKVRSLDGLRAWVIRELTDDLARGAESKFRKILPYPQGVSEQEREALHRIWFPKVVGGGVHELTLVPFHVAAEELGPMEVHHPFGASYGIGPRPGDGVVPEQVLWWRGAYFLVKPRAEDGIADQIAAGFPQKIDTSEREKLDGEFEKTRDLLQDAIAKAEENRDSAYSRILENTFRRDLAVIRQRSSFPYSQVRELDAHLRYLRNLKDQGGWEDQRPTGLAAQITIRVPVTPVEHDPEISGFTRPVPGLDIGPAGQKIRLDGVDGLVSLGDEVDVTVGEIRKGVVVGFVVITAADGTKSAIFRRIREFTAKLRALKKTAPSRAWTADHPLFVESYRSTTSITSKRRLGVTLGGPGGAGTRSTSSPQSYLPKGVVAGGGSFNFPTINRIGFEAGFDAIGRPTVVVEMLARKSRAGQNLYFKLVHPAPTVDDIIGMSQSADAVWELEDRWDLADAATYNGVIVSDSRLPAPLRTRIGAAGKTFGGEEVQLAPETEITFRVGKWPRLAGLKRGVFVVVRAPLVGDASRHAYRLVVTGKKMDEFDGIIKTLNERQEGAGQRIPLAESAPRRRRRFRGKPGAGVVPGQAWRLDPPSFVGSYHITASLYAISKNSQKLNVEFAGSPVYIPQAVIDGDSFVFPADIKKVRLELGYDSTGRSAAFVELPAENSPNGRTLYVELEPAPTADDIESLRKKALWVPQNQWDLSEAEEFEDALTKDNQLPPPLNTSLGTEGATLGGAKVDVTAQKMVTFWVGKWKRQVGSESVTGVFVVVRAPLVGGTGHAYKIIKTRRTVDQLAALKEELRDRQESFNMRILRGWQSKPTGQGPDAGGESGAGHGSGAGDGLPGHAAPIASILVPPTRRNTALDSTDVELGPLPEDPDPSLPGSDHSPTLGVVPEEWAPPAGSDTVVDVEDLAGAAVSTVAASSAAGAATARGSVEPVEIDAERWRPKRVVDPRGKPRFVAFDVSLVEAGSHGGTDGPDGGLRARRLPDSGERIAVRFALVPGDEWVIRRRLFVEGPPDAVEQVKQDTLDGIAALNGKPAVLPEVGKTLRWEVQFVDDEALAHQKVTVVAKGSGTDQRRWAADEDPGVYVHEVVHGAGVVDRDDSTLMGPHRHGGDWRLSDKDLGDIVEILKPHYAGVVGSDGPAVRPAGAASAAQGPATVQELWDRGFDVPPRYQKPPAEPVGNDLMDDSDSDSDSDGDGDGPYVPSSRERAEKAAVLGPQLARVFAPPPGPSAVPGSGQIAEASGGDGGAVAPPVPAAPAPASPEIVDSPEWDGFFQRVLDRAGGQVAETLGLPAVEIDDVRHYLAVEVDRIVGRTDFRDRLDLSGPSLGVLREALDSRGRSVPGLTRVLPHLVSVAFGIDIAVFGSGTVGRDQGAGPQAGTGQGRLRRPAGRGRAAAPGGPDSGEFGPEPMVQDAELGEAPPLRTGDRAGRPADAADGWTAGAPPQLTGGYTKEVKLDRRGRLWFTLDGQPLIVDVAAANQEATVWFGHRKDRLPAGEPAAAIEVESLEGREDGPFWRWLDPAPTEDDLRKLKTYEHRTVRAGRWTEGEPPKLPGGYTKEVPLNSQGRLPFPVGGKKPGVGAAAAGQEVTVRFGPRTDGSPEGELAGWIKVKSLEGRKGGPLWRWLDPAPTKEDLKRLQTYERRTVHAGEWTEGEPPKLTGGYTKDAGIDQQGRLSLKVGGTRVVGMTAAGQRAMAWFGHRTDESHAGEPAAWIKVGSLNDRKGGPFWRWLDWAPTKNELKKLQKYKTRTKHAGEWTAGDPPQLTDGYTKEVPINPQGQLPFPVGGKTRDVGVAAAGRMATVWFGPRTDGSHAGEPAAWIKVERLDGREDGSFWRWLDPAPTQDDLDSLRTYENRNVDAGDWTAGDPPQLTDGDTKEIKLDPQGQLPFPVGGTPGVGVAAAGRDATVWFGPRTDRLPEGELAAWVKVESLEGREGGPFWLWLDPAPTQDDLDSLRTYENRTVDAGAWTAGDPPELTEGYTKKVQLDQQGRLPFKVRRRRPLAGAAAADQMATIWFGHRTDESHEGEPAAAIEVESLEGQEGGPFWRWLDLALTEDDLENLKKYKPRTVHAGRWTTGDRPQLTDWYTKTIQLDRRGQLPFTVGDNMRLVGVPAANQEATVWFGRRTDEPHKGKPAAWIEVESLDGQKGGPFWRWLDPAPTKEDLKRLEIYEPRTVPAGGWTAGNPPELTNGHTKKIRIDPQGRLPFTVNGKTRSVGAAAANRETTVWLGPRTDEWHAGELAAWIKVESLEGREGGQFWRWLPAPTKKDLERLQAYEYESHRAVDAGGWTAGDPPQLTGGSSDNAAAVTPASTGSVAAAY
ncbi:hypothetical protein ABGB16_32670, partial [Micromonospora sp. B11E3]|uniref:hypothetical protein n=1 Tax=Micromonospora sp. B11E3 TaxID=3153562 RepID=UPI00325D4CEC